MLELKKKKISLFISLFVAAQGLLWGFPGSSAGREPAWNAGDPSSIPGSRKISWRRGRLPTPVFLGFPGGSDGKEPACNAEDLGLIPGLGRSPGGGHGNPLQYSCLENPSGQRSLAGYSRRGGKELDAAERLSAEHHKGFCICDTRA